jgi:hypothetical protein
MIFVFIYDGFDSTGIGSRSVTVATVRKKMKKTAPTW